MLKEYDPFNSYMQTALDAQVSAATTLDMVRMLLDGLL